MCLAYFTLHNVFQVRIYSIYVAFLYYFLRLNNILLYTYITFCLSIHPLMDIWVASTFQLLWTYYEHGCANVCMSSAFNSLGIYSEVELLDHMVILTFWENLTRILILNFKNSFSHFISGNTSIHSFVRVPVSEHKVSCGTKVSAQVGQQEMVTTWIALSQVNWAELDGQKFSWL